MATSLVSHVQWNIIGGLTVTGNIYSSTRNNVKARHVRREYGIGDDYLSWSY